jgi:hypothetical protein
LHHYDPDDGSGSIEDVEENFNNTANRYGKPVVLVETGFAFRGSSESEYEFDVSEAGQQEFLETLIDLVKNVPNGLGQGVYWWYAEARPSSGLSVWQNGRYGLFDQSGDLLSAAEAFLEPVIVEPQLGDYNGDGLVNAADYIVWRNTFDQTGRTLAADGDGDGRVDQDDYDIWKNAYNNGPAEDEGGAESIPEPTSLLLTLLAATSVYRRRRIRDERPTWS